MDKAIRKRRGRSGVPTTFIIVAWTVLSLTDHRPTEAAVFRCSSGDASCLIQSINASNNNNEDNAIFLEAGTYTLTQASPDESGLPNIRRTLSIIGAGAETTIIQRDKDAPSFGIIFVAGAFGPGGFFPATLTLDGVTIAGGNAGLGGGIRTFNGNLVFSNSILRDNTASSGGGIYSESEHGIGPSVTIKSSIIRDNRASFDGGGIFDVQGDQMVISDSTISTNHALRGGGIATVNSATGPLIVRSSLVANEVTEAGGGIINGASHTTLINVTVGGNRARVGGGILNAQALADHPGTADIINSTIANNIASAQGGGIFAGVLSDVNFNLQSTIIAQNSASSGQDWFCSGLPGLVISFGNNLIGETSRCSVELKTSDRTGDPGLGEFLDPGIPGKARFPLRSDNPAIEAGDNAACSALATDQLGQPRSVAGSIPLDGPRICDIGAVEFFLPVNQLVTERESERVTQFDPTPVPGAPGGTFLIIAKFDNISDTSPPGPVFANKTIFFPFFEVAAIQLSRAGVPPEDQPVLLNADGGPGRVGARLTPQGSLTIPFPPGTTAPSFEFHIGLQKREPFVFFLNMLGEPRSSTSSVSMR